MGDYIYSPISRFWRNTGRVAHALQQVSYQLFKLVTGEFGHDAFDDEVAGAGFRLHSCGYCSGVIVSDIFLSVCLILR